jgi:hypothetical protein
MVSAKRDEDHFFYSFLVSRLWLHGFSAQQSTLKLIA